MNSFIKSSFSIDLGGAEISAYAKAQSVALVITGGNTVKLVDLADRSEPAELAVLPLDGAAQSVDVSGDLVAIAIADAVDPRANNGRVAFFRLNGVGADTSLLSLGSVSVGALPDSLKFN